MIDLRGGVTDLYRQLGRANGEGGRIILFTSARTGEGVSSIAAAFALKAAETARKPVWLLDLDLRRNHAFNAFAVGSLSQKFGGVGPPYSASLRTEPFFAIDPPDPGVDTAPGAGIFTAHRVGETRLMVTQFDHARLKPSQSLKIRTQPAYWAAVRAATDWAIIDAPALERSGAALAIASQADRTVIVVRADSTSIEDVASLNRELTAHGANVAGAVLNRQKSDARFIDRMTA